MNRDLSKDKSRRSDIIPFSFNLVDKVRKLLSLSIRRSDSEYAIKLHDILPLGRNGKLITISLADSFKLLAVTDGGIRVLESHPLPQRSSNTEAV